MPVTTKKYGKCVKCGEEHHRNSLYPYYRTDYRHNGEKPPMSERYKFCQGCWISQCHKTKGTDVPAWEYPLPNKLEEK